MRIQPLNKDLGTENVLNTTIDMCNRAKTSIEKRKSRKSSGRKGTFIAVILLLVVIKTIV